MYCFTTFCYCCLKKEDQLINIHEIDDNDTSYEEKLFICQLLKYNDLLLEEIPKGLCQKCVTDIDLVFNFRKTFLKKQETLKNYILSFLNLNTNFANSYGKLSLDLVKVDKFLDDSINKSSNDDSSVKDELLVESDKDESSVKDELLVETDEVVPENEELFNIDEETVNFELNNQFLQKNQESNEENISCLDDFSEKCQIKIEEIQEDTEIHQNFSNSEQENNNVVNREEIEEGTENPNSCNGEENINVVNQKEIENKISKTQENFNFTNEEQEIHNFDTKIDETHNFQGKEDQIPDFDIVNEFRTHFLDSENPKNESYDAKKSILNNEKQEKILTKKRKRKSLENNARKKIHIIEDVKLKNYSLIEPKKLYSSSKDIQQVYCVDDEQQSSSSTQNLNYGDVQQIENENESNNGETILTVVRSEKDNSWQIISVPKKDVNPTGNNFSCDICDMSFKLENDLRIHSLSHKNSDHECIYCDAKFSSSTLLKEHERKHRWQRPYTCKICKRVLCNKQALSVHFKRHMGIFNFKCNICDKGLYSKERLESHRLKHYKHILDLKSNKVIEKYLQNNLEPKFEASSKKLPDGNVASNINLPKNIRREFKPSRKFNYGSKLISNNRAKCKFCNKVFRSHYYLPFHYQRCRNPSARMENKNQVIENDLETISEVISEELPDSNVVPNINSPENIGKEEKISRKFNYGAKCKFCKKLFHSHNYLPFHYQRCRNPSARLENTENVSKSTFLCHLCPKKFNLNIKLKKHLRNKHNQSELPKSQNGEKLEQISRRKPGRPRKLQNPEQKQENGGRFETVIRKKPGRPPKRQVNKFEIDLVDGKKIYENGAENLRNKCQYCDRKFMNHMMLENHMYIHTGFYNFQCEYCPIKFPSKRAVQNHTNRMHDSTFFHCDHCKKYFKTRHYLNKHVLMVHRNVAINHSCEFCDKTFFKLSLLWKHKKNHTPEEKIYRCSECENVYGNYHHLMRHISVHCSDKPYKCDYCSDTFRSNYNLSRHISTHKVKEAHSESQNVPSSKNLAVVSKDIEEIYHSDDIRDINDASQIYDF